MPANKLPKMIANTMPTATKRRLALAQFALLGFVLLLKVHTRSMIRLTTGMSMRSIVMIHSPKLTDEWFVTSFFIRY